MSNRKYLECITPATMPSLSHHKLEDLLLTQNFTLCLVVDSKDIYDKNKEYIKNENYDDSLLRYYDIITRQNRIKSLFFPYN